MADNLQQFDLLPCPFCGSARVDPQGWASTDSAGPACDDCGASAGGAGNTLQKNIVAWNRRSSMPGQPEVIRIPAGDGLDPITVYADDLGEGRGRLTVCCYADSWSYTAAWGAMGGSLHGFVAGLNPHYLADNLLWPNAPKAKKHQRQYVERIAAAVIATFARHKQGVRDA